MNYVPSASEAAALAYVDEHPHLATLAKESGLALDTVYRMRRRENRKGFSTISISKILQHRARHNRRPVVEGIIPHLGAHE